MEPRHPMQSARRKYGQMLKVALAPAAVARGEIQQRWRAFLEATAKRGHHPDFPACPAQQRSLDEVVAHNMSAERFAAPQFGQRRILCKGAHANDGVMPPIIAFGAMPPRNARSDQRPVQASGELLQSCKQRFCIDDDRKSLDQGDLWMTFHRVGEPGDGIGGHQTVCIEDDHMVIRPTEPLYPVFDVAGFPRGILRAMSVIEVRNAEVTSKLQEALLFRDPYRGVSGITQHKPVK